MTRVWSLTVDYDGNLRASQMVSTLYSSREKAEKAQAELKLNKWQQSWVTSVEVK